jgi:hypothetical protein
MGVQGMPHGCGLMCLTLCIIWICIVAPCNGQQVLPLCMDYWLPMCLQFHSAALACFMPCQWYDPQSTIVFGLPYYIVTGTRMP